MRVPLWFSIFGFTLLFVALHMKAMRNEVLRRRLKSLTLAEVERAQATGGGGLGLAQSRS
jgi:heme exporter protein C